MSLTVALVGNPNSGKSTVFNALTGSRQRIGNWPGVTVDRKLGQFTYQNQVVEVVDLPGTYSLTSITEQQCLDEKIACEFLLSDQFDVVVNVVDASNLERNLYLTLQLMEMGVPVIVALNMMDVAQKRRINIDTKLLEQKLGCEVITLAADKNKASTMLKKLITQKSATIPQAPVTYPESVAAAIKNIAAQLQGSEHWRRWCAIHLLEGDYLAYQHADATVMHTLDQSVEQIQASSGEEADILIADARYTLAHQIIEEVASRETHTVVTMSSKLDNIMLHRYLGIPIFLAIMYIMFFFVINVGSALQDYIDTASSAIFVTGLHNVLSSWHLPLWLVAIIADGAGRGINTTLTFIPVIGAMFLFLSFLEGSGYMARAAFVVDRLMRFLGLPGKSFVPMIVGFGCNVPAIMSARTLDNPRDRVLTIMMSPFMSCGARLAIYAIFTAAFFPSNGHNVVFALYMIGILMAVITGVVLRKTILKGEPSELVMEMPAYHLPRLRMLLQQTWHRLQSFIFRAGKYIVPVCMLIGSLNAIPVHYHKQDTTVLAAAGQMVTPFFRPMGIEQDNWPATVGLMTGVLAKEVVVGTLNTLYSDASHSSESPQGAFGVMYQRFGGPVAAFAYLLFVLLYFPCISATSAMVKELSRGWAFFSVFWTTAIAYGAAVVFYQCATIAQHFMVSMSWIGLMLALFATTLYFFRNNTVVGVS